MEKREVKASELALNTGLVSVPQIGQKGEFGFRVVNGALAATAAKNVAICPGLFPTTAELGNYGLSVDAILADGNLATDLDANAKDGQLRINQFVKGLLHGAFRLEQMNVSTDNEETFEQIIKFTGNSAFGKSEVVNIDMTDFVDEYQSNAKKSLVDFKARGKEMILSKDSVLILPFASASTVNITLIGTWFRPQYPFSK